MLPTIEEYRDQLKRHDRRTTCEVTLAIAIGMAIGFVIVQAMSLLELHLGKGRGNLLSLGLIAMGGLPIIYVLWRADRPGKRFPYLRCRHCEGVLNLRTQKYVIATRNCPHCGKQVIRIGGPEEAGNAIAPALPGTTNDLPTYAEYHQDRMRESKRSTRWVWLLFGGIFAWMLFGLAAAKVAELWLTPVQSIFVALLTWLLSLPLLWLVNRQARRPSPRFLAAQCPHCNVSLATQTELRIVTATSHCPGCGCQVVKDGPDGGRHRSSRDQVQPQSIEPLIAESSGFTRPSALPTSEEFIAKGRRLDRFMQQHAKVAFGGIFVFIAIAGTYLAVMLASDEQLSQRPPTTIEIAPVAILLILGCVWVIAVILRTETRAGTISNIKCPHCQASLRDQRARYLVIASRNCPYCGQRVLRAEGNEA